MDFGIFDHIDDSGLRRGEQLEQRLRLVEQYDRDGFYAYHVAEHHGTPLGIVGEAFDLITRAFAAEGTFSFQGTYTQVAEMPLTARPLQQPHPPFWFGASRPDRAPWCAERAINVMSLVDAQRTRITTDGYMTMDVAFGGITFEEASRTASMFVSDVMPAFTGASSEARR